jgi:hypothetical protein
MKKSSKAILCILLSILLPVPFIGVTAKEKVPLTVWVAADIHYKPQSDLGPIEEQTALPGDPLYNHVNGKGMLTYEADAIIYEFLDRFEKSSSNILLLPGDVSEDGHWSQHLGIAKILNEFKARTGKKIFVIPGNHDIRTSASGGRLDLSDFLTVYENLGYSDALVSHGTSGSYTAELDSEYRLLAIDACIYREDGSRVTPELLAWIEEQVQQAKVDGKKLIGMVHHSMLDHFGIQSVAGNLLCLDNYRENATKFADWGIKYVFTGHGHANDIAMAVSAKGNRIYDIETGSLITYPNAYRTVTFSDTAVEVKTDYIDTIDTSFLPAGYNQAKLNLIQSDFPAYSFGYFKSSLVSVAYDMPYNTGRIAKSLKIEQGTKEYEALSAVMQIVGDALKLPLYDIAGTPAIDSVEEIAVKAGITLEPSDYKNALEIAGALYAWHYAGDEDTGYDSLEVTLFRQSFNAALVYALTNIPFSMANTLFAGIGLPSTGFGLQDNLYSQTARMIYLQTAAKLIFIEFVKPLLNSISSDTYAPGDVNETLEPYGVNWELPGRTAIITDTGYIMNIILGFIKTILNAVKSLIAI